MYILHKVLFEMKFFCKAKLCTKILYFAKHMSKSSILKALKTLVKIFDFKSLWLSTILKTKKRSFQCFQNRRFWHLFCKEEDKNTKKYKNNEICVKNKIGDDRDRTDDLMRAKHTFYQLNYTPVFSFTVWIVSLEKLDFY